jgi:glycosyltransferase involved in cell wall biosynthesis
MFSALAGAWHVKNAIRSNNIDVVMPRSTLPALATLLAMRGSNCPMVFDADGLPLDERVDFAGQSPSSLVYRLLRDIEAQAVRRASAVLTRTAKAAEILLSRAGAGTGAAKFHIVTNGRDSDHFKPADAENREEVRKRLGIDTACPLLVYAGSMGPQYCIHEMLSFFSYVRRRVVNAHFLILTGSPEMLQAALIAHPQERASVTTLSVPADRVAEYLAAADLGLALRKPTFSMQAVAPIKLGEYLLCGLPVVATAGVGDTSVVPDDVGYLLQRMNDEELESAADWFVNTVLSNRDEISSRARAVGLNEFSLEVCAATYERAFQSLGAKQ